MSCYRALANVCITLHSAHMNDVAERKMAISLIRNGIFDCKSIHSGYVSEAAKHMKVSEVTKEHFLPRAQSATKIFSMLDTGATVDDVEKFIIECCTVHYVTKEENNRLRKFQRDIKNYPTWPDQYRAAEINLVLYIKKTAKKWVYIINGIEYSSAKEAALANSCDIQTLNNRCVIDKRGKFPNWIRKKYEE